MFSLNGSLETIFLMGWVLALALEEHGEPFRAFLSAFGEYTDDAVDHFYERYIGEYATRADFAGDLLENTGELEAIPERLSYCVDLDAYGRDLLLGGDVVESGGYWFWNF